MTLATRLRTAVAFAVQAAYTMLTAYAVLEETMRPAHVSLWLRNHRPYGPKAIRSGEE